MANSGPPRLDLRPAAARPPARRGSTSRPPVTCSAGLGLSSLPPSLLSSLPPSSPAISASPPSPTATRPSAHSSLASLPPPPAPLHVLLPAAAPSSTSPVSAPSTKTSSPTPPQATASSNVSFPTLVPLFLVDGSLGFPRSPKSVKIRVPDFPFSPFLLSFLDGEGGADDAAGDRDQTGDLRIFGRGLNLDRQNVMVILYLLTLLSSTHSLAILGFILSYTSILGIVFVAVTTSLLEKPVSITGTIYSGARLGIRRLTGFVFLRWAARDAVVQFLCMWFFADVGDQNELFKLFVKVKLMPFSLLPLNPWSGPRDAVLSGFFVVWAFLDTVVSALFALVPWVVIIDHNLRRRGRCVVREGCYLISMMPAQAILLKCLETLACGNLGRRFAMMVGGRLFAEVFHSLAEVYFFMVWLIFYFAARCKDGELEGRSFGRQDLAECINGLRYYDGGAGGK